VELVNRDERISNKSLQHMVPGAGFEPTRPCGQGILRHEVKGNEISNLLISLPFTFSERYG
jgi:hypothetical protein